MKVLNAKSFWTFDCKGCQSTLEADPADVEFAWFGANWGGDSREKEYYVTCPVCGTDNFVPAAKLTDQVKAQAKPYQPPANP